MSILIFMVVSAIGISITDALNSKPCRKTLRRITRFIAFQTRIGVKIRKIIRILTGKRYIY